MKWIKLDGIWMVVDEDCTQESETDETVPEDVLVTFMKRCHRLAELYSNEAKRYHNQILELYYNKDKK